MAIYDYYSPSAGYDTGKITIIRASIDFSVQNLAATDDLRIARIEAGTLILHSMYKNTRAEGAALTVDVGTAQNGTQICSNFNCNSLSTDYTEGSIKFSSDTVTEIDSDGYIWLNVDHAADYAIFDLMLFVCKNNENVIAT